MNVPRSIWSHLNIPLTSLIHNSLQNVQLRSHQPFEDSAPEFRKKGRLFICANLQMLARHREKWRCAKSCIGMALHWCRGPWVWPSKPARPPPHSQPSRKWLKGSTSSLFCWVAGTLQSMSKQQGYFLQPCKSKFIQVMVFNKKTQKTWRKSRTCKLFNDHNSMIS